MTEAEINKALYRPLENGNNYNALIPKPEGIAITLGKGQTKHALLKMQEWAYRFQHEAIQLSEVLERSTLEETIDEIQDFLYPNFQYKIDGETQMLRSLSRAWWDERTTGIDCKSFSVVASQILLCLGIKHYLRRIIQLGDENNAYTHVYVVVPKDQDTANLANGYFMIDGTIKLNNEVPFKKSDDLFMEPELEIVGLAAPKVARMGCPDCGGGCGQNNYSLGCPGCGSTCGQNQYSGGLGISLDDFSGMFSSGWSPNCIGGTLDKKDLDVFKPAVINGFDEIVQDFNYAVTTKNANAIKVAANMFLQSAAQLLDQSRYYQSHNWSSNCSKNTVAAFVSIASHFNTVAFEAFLPYLQEFFDVVTTVKTVKNNTYPFETYKSGQGLYKPNFVRDIQSIQISSLSFSPDVDAIPAFEYTTDLINSIEGSSFNLNGFLDSLTNVAAQFSSPNSNGNFGNNGGSIQPINQGSYNQTKAGGVGMVLAIAAIAGGMIYGVKKFA